MNTRSLTKKPVQRLVHSGQTNNGFTFVPTEKPGFSPNREFETTRPMSHSPTRVEPTEEPVQTFSELSLKRASTDPTNVRPYSQNRHLIDPFCVEIHVNPRECPRQAKEDIEAIMKMVLEEIHVMSDRDYFFNGNLVFCYMVFPYRRTLDQVKRQNLRQDLAWRARHMQNAQLASALARAPLIDMFPCAPHAPPQGRLTLEMDSNTNSHHFHPPQSRPYLTASVSNRSTYQNLVQPAVTHLVSKTKKKRAKALPADYRARQNLVQLKHNKALALLRPWLLDESQEKIYLRGDNVAFIQVKCPRALHAIDSFLEQILNDETIEIVRCTAPLSRKRQGQLKGYLLYVTCRTAAMVSRIIDIFNKDFSKSGLKCKTACFDKSHPSFGGDNSEGSETSV